MIKKSRTKARKGADFRYAAPLGILLLLHPGDFNQAYAVVHDISGKVSCIDCHTKLPFKGTKVLLNERAAEQCVECHVRAGDMSETISHIVNTVPSMKIPVDLPLDPKGRMTCITCHTFHQDANAEHKKTSLLRRPRGKTFCSSCHRNRKW